MEEKKSIFSILWHQIVMTFSMAIILASIFGWILGDAAMEHGGFFHLGSAGLPFQSIAQMFGLSTVLSVLVILLMSDTLLKKVMLLWRVALLLFLCIVATAAFALIFRWIPLGAWDAWAAMLGTFTASFLIGFSTMFIKTKLDDRRYEKQLSNYKMKQNQEETK